MLDQGVLKDLSQVDVKLALCRGDLGKVAQEWDVVSVHSVVHSVHPLRDLVHVSVVEFAHDEQFTMLAFGRFFCNADPSSGEHPADVRYSVQSEAVHANFTYHPLAPSLHILSNLSIRVIDVGEHEVVIVAHGIINVGGPILLAPVWVNGCSGTRKCLWRIDDFVDGILLRTLIPVCTAEVLPMPFQAAVVVSAAREVEVDPGFDLLRRCLLDCAVCRVLISLTRRLRREQS
jgi:hypothetical protein